MIPPDENQRRLNEWALKEEMKANPRRTRIKIIITLIFVVTLLAIGIYAVLNGATGNPYQ